MKTHSRLAITWSLLTVAILTLAACSPKLDWREIRAANAQYIVQMPAKPASHAREIDLDGKRVTMTMVASEVDGVTYAVGDAAMPDAGSAQLALIAMKTAMIKNIDGTVKQQKVSTMPHGSGPQVRQLVVTDIAVDGGTAKGPARRMHARFVARDAHVVQLVVAGPADAVKPEAVDTFFSSFKFQ